VISALALIAVDACMLTETESRSLNETFFDPQSGIHDRCHGSGPLPSSTRSVRASTMILSPQPL